MKGSKLKLIWERYFLLIIAVLAVKLLVLLVLPLVIPEQSLPQLSYFQTIMLIVLISPIIGYYLFIPFQKETEQAEFNNKALLEASVDGVIVIDDDGKVLIFNKAAERIFGYSAEEMLGQPVFILLPENEQQKYRKRMEIFRDSGNRSMLGKSTEIFGRRKNGEIFPFRVSIGETEIDNKHVFMGIVHDATEQKRMENILKTATQGVSAETGVMFFQSLVRYLAETLNVEYALVAMLKDKETARALAFYNNGVIKENFEYDLRGTPCEQVVGNEPFLYLSGIQSQFPNDYALVELGVESYIGVPLFDSKGQPLGLINVMSRRPIRDAEMSKSLLKIFAVRAAAEIERQRQEWLLKAHNRIFEQMALGVYWRQILENICLLYEERFPGSKCSVLVLNENGDRLLYGAAPSLPEAYNQQVHNLAIGPSVGSCGTAAYLRKQVIVSDVTADPLWCDYKQLGLTYGFRACWSTPIISHNDNCLGTFAVYYAEPSEPREDELNLIEQFVSLAALCIENHRADIERRKFLRAIEASADTIIITDSNGLIQWANSAFEKTTGYTIREALFKKPGELLSSGKHDKSYYAKMWKTIKAGKVWHGEFINKRKDGSLYTEDVTITPMKDDNGEITHYIAIKRDISERKWMEEELRSSNEQLAAALQKANEMTIIAETANRAKSAFLATMSHEIRTPMNAILGMAELLLDTDIDAEQRDYLQTLSKSADILLNLINDILDLSKIEAGKLTLEKTAFNLYEMVEDVGNLFAAIADEKGLEVVVNIDPKLPAHFLGDPVRLRQILANFVSNAIKFTEKGEIIISVWEGKPVKQIVPGDESEVRWLRFSVRDTGIGIPKEKLGVIFEAFTQADSSTTRRFGGTGLGLAICKSLVELMGGQIGVESELNEGSCFYFDIPLPVNTAADAGEKTAQTPAAAQFADLKVMVVDDNHHSRESLVKHLEHWQCRVEPFEDPKKALETLIAQSDTPYQVVLLDYQMPDFDGLEFIRELKAKKSELEAKIVFLASANNRLDSGTLATYGIDAQLPKPVRQFSLRQTLQRLVADQNGKAALTLRRPQNKPDNKAVQINAKVLLVEDNPVNQKVAVRMLEKLGCEVEVAINGREGVEMTAAKQYDVVLMDVQMPVMDGFEATRQIREREKNSAVHHTIIAMTANAMEGDRERCLIAGMDDYISKPVSKESLLKILTKWTTQPTLSDE
jgi:PAS domain S-box-containing protein